MTPNGLIHVRLPKFLRAMRLARSRAAVAEAVLRGVGATPFPERLAKHLVNLAAGWLGGEAWALILADEGRGITWLADRGVSKARRPPVIAIAERTMKRGQVVWTDGDKAGPGPSRAHFTALAMPLRARGHVVGALVGLESRDEKRLKLGLSRGEMAPLLDLLGGMAGALDTAAKLKRAEALSARDDLTGLFNARFMANALRREVKRSVRTGRPVSLLFIDLDGFKGINDRHGHLYGSRALVEAAVRINASARETDVIARYGGDEFALILPETPPEGALLVANRIRDLIAGQTFLAPEGINFRLTASIGVASLPQVAATPQELLAAADAAMYAVKERGKNGIEVARPGMTPPAKGQFAAMAIGSGPHRIAPPVQYPAKAGV